MRVLKVQVAELGRLRIVDDLCATVLVGKLLLEVHLSLFLLA